jgi:hypothetical protein
MKCLNCPTDCTPDTVGIQINNYHLENIPGCMQICKNCVDDIAISLMSGGLSLSSIGKITGLLKGLKG